ncbi:hypothetical protein PCANC_15144 [Puccinia coronata f. sp. avenae]|uniref:Uncharacterized protein n=1 Tax=Puccinia coronata f. sp. avenae TaxID=200324 RepID=A0A2N5SMM2_9BASI|nr:hypothetical protein PCANC_15144 [Puccinia coronata f. sp. avenae]
MILARAVVLISLQFIDLFHVVQSVRSPGQLSTHWRVQRNILNILDWHEKTQPIQCSLGWARKTLPPAYGTTLASCEDATHQESICDQGSCHMGQADESPADKPLIKFLYFVDCQKVEEAVFGHQPAKRYTVFPRTYDVDDVQGQLLAQGFAVENEGRLEENYVCKWSDQLQQNLQRVWCNNCTDIALD